MNKNLPIDEKNQHSFLMSIDDDDITSLIYSTINLCNIGSKYFPTIR